MAPVADFPRAFDEADTPVVMAWLDQIPLLPLALIALFLGLAPFHPEPHLVEKLRMLSQGRLVRPLDIFDLLLHATPVVLLLMKLLRLATAAGPQAP